MPSQPTISNEEFYFRGAFMSLFIDIEFLLGDTLAVLLVGDTEVKLNLIEFINPKLMLDPKTSLLHTVLKSKNNVAFTKYKDTLEELRKFGSLRNDFAHKRIKIDSTAKKLSFLVLNDGKFIENGYPYSDLEKRFESLKNIMQQLNSLHNELLAASK